MGLHFTFTAMLNKLLNWQSLTICTLFLLSLINYFYLEQLLILKINFLIFGVIFVYLFIWKNSFQWLIFLLLYLIGFSLYYYLAIGSLAIWITILLFVLVVGGLTFILVQPIITKFSSQFFYSFLILIVNLQIFLALVPWPVNMQSKSVILLSVIYFCWGLLNLKIEDKLNWQGVLPYLLTTFIIITAIISTVSWVEY